MKKKMSFNQRKLTIVAVGLCISAISTLHFQANAAPPTLPDQVCNNPSIEKQLQARENALLGGRHAAEHAAARKKICAIASGQDNQLTVEQAANTAANAATVAPASAAGRWSSTFIIPVVGITSVLLHNKKVLFWSYDPANHFQPNGANTGKAYLWDPGTRTGQYIDPPDNIWCGGQTILSDGRVFIAGGNLRYPDPNAAPGFTGYEGTLTTYTFNPSANSWTRQPDMAYGRWYPTVTQLSNNQAVITSGYDQYGSNTLNQTVEVFTPSSNRNGVGTITTLSSTSNHNPTGYYPFQYQLGSASMLQAGPEASNSFQLDPRTWNWSATGNLLNAHRSYGTGVLFIDASVSPAAQRVVIMNGFNESGGFANNEWLDANNPLGGWQAFPNLVTRRHNANTVILPNGTLLTVGGNSGSDEYSNRLYTVELYSKPAGDPTGSWTQLSANASIPSAYHSSAILLPNATVLLSEDDLSTAFQAGTGETHRGQIYSPPYLFNGTRPQILSAPTTASVGARIDITADTSQISSAVLVAPGATTHANDMHQRFIKLPITANNSIISATLPASSALVPPGYYMLFILNNNGVPSVAKFIKIS